MMQRGNKDSYFKIATKEQNQSNNEMNIDQTIQKEIQQNE